MRRTPDAETVRLAAANLAAWHGRSVDAIGTRSLLDPHWWTCQIDEPSIWFTAISLSPASSAGDEAVANILRDPRRVASVCDSYARLDLRSHGLVRARQAPWYARAPDLPPPTVRLPAGCEISRVRTDAQLAEFERTAVVAFGAPAPPAPFTLHAPAILSDPAMEVWIAHAQGRPAATAMTYDAYGVRGVYGVGTVPGQRGRGLASALMGTIVADRPDVTSTLQPSAMSTRLYQALGFAPIGEYTFWRTA